MASAAGPAPNTGITVTMPTSHKIDSHNVVKLGTDNYEQWKLQMSLTLKSNKLWDYVSGTIPKPAENAPVVDIKAWEDKDWLAQATMVTTLDPTNTGRIYSLPTAKEMYDKLASIHSDSSVLNRQHVSTSFLNYKPRKGTTPSQIYNDLESMARHLNEMGVATDESWTVLKIVSALPDEQHLYCKTDSI